MELNWRSQRMLYHFQNCSLLQHLDLHALIKCEYYRTAKSLIYPYMLL